LLGLLLFPIQNPHLRNGSPVQIRSLDQQSHVWRLLQTLSHHLGTAIGIEPRSPHNRDRPQQIYALQRPGTLPRIQDGGHHFDPRRYFEADELSVYTLYQEEPNHRGL